MKTNYLKKYIISSYILVWMLIIFVAGSASLIPFFLFPLISHELDYTKYYCMVSDLSAFDWMETVQTK